MRQRTGYLHILIITWLALTTGCQGLSQNSAQTPWPADYLPSVIAMTAGADATSTANALDIAELGNAIPTDTAVIPATEPPYILPAGTSTPSPEPLPAVIRILAPGPLSRESSPLNLRAYVVTGESGQTRVELLGEDGRLLARKVMRLASRSSEGVYVSIKIPFEIEAAAELGRLQIITEDRSGQIHAQMSVHLLLLSVGNDEINPPGSLVERCFLFEPLPGASISGGMLAIRGEMQPFNAQPVILELLDQYGNSLGLRGLTFSSVDKQFFMTTVPYKVSQPTQARLVIRQGDDRIAGLMYLYSQKILLNP